MKSLDPKGSVLLMDMGSSSRDMSTVKWWNIDVITIFLIMWGWLRNSDSKKKSILLLAIYEIDNYVFTRKSKRSGQSRVSGTRLHSKSPTTGQRMILKKWAQRIGDAYNKTFVHNWEYYPLTEWGNSSSLLDNLLSFAIPSLIKIINPSWGCGWVLAWLSPDVPLRCSDVAGRYPWLRQEQSSIS